MAPQSPLRLFKRALIHHERDGKRIPHGTRGLYVLYNERPGPRKIFDVVYIGVGGTKLASGIGARIWNHKREGKKSEWTHYSIFEVHDNVSGEEILELESFLLRIFKYDSRVKLDNVKFGSKAFKKISNKALWQAYSGKSE